MFVAFPCQAERSVEDAAGAMAKPVGPGPGSGEVSEWIRSIGGGGKLSERLIEEIEDSYDHLRQISDNYRWGTRGIQRTRDVFIVTFDSPRLVGFCF